MASEASSEQPAIITIEDPTTGSKIDFRVHPSIAKTLKVLLEGGTATISPSWDAGCRV